MTSVRLKDTTDVVRRPAWVGPTEPTSGDTVTVGPGTLWVDDSTTPNVLKRRNDTDDGWVAVGLVTGTTAVTAAAGNHNHTHDSLTGRTTDNHHTKAHNVGDAADHPDVLVTSPATGDALVYDATAVKWKNVPVSGGVTLSSANPTTAAPSDAAAPGTSLSATHGDHRHGMPATWPPTSHAHSAHSGLGSDDHTQYQLLSERGLASGYAPLDSGLLVPVANLGTGTPTGSKFLRDDRTWAVPAGGGGGSLTIEEVDGTPSVASATKLILPNGTVSVTGTEATYTPTGGGSGNTTSTGAAGSEPGSPASGDLYLPNNGFAVERYSGSAWVPWGPLFPLTAPPAASGFTWDNQGGATLVDSAGALVLTAPTDATGVARVVYKTAPATPYTLTVGFLAALYQTLYPQTGLVFRESSSGKLCNFSVDGTLGDCYLIAGKWTSASAYSATYSQVTSRALRGGLMFLRIADNGTSRICSFSTDGRNFVTFHTVGRTDYLTADRIGLIATGGGAGPTVMTVLSYVVV